MSKSNAIVLSVVQRGLSSDEAARKFRVSKRRVNKLLVKYRSGGLAALKPLSQRPLTAPNKTPQSLEDQIVRLRLELKEQGFDAGPASIAPRLKLAGRQPPAISTISRILHKHPLIIPQPRKRPRSSYIRFEASQAQ